MPGYILTLRCADGPGIVKAAADGILEVGGNIVENNQYSDPAAGVFCMRTRFESPSGPGEATVAIFRSVSRFEPTLAVRPEAERRRVLVMVSKLDHCLVDLLYRQEVGELAVDIPLVVSNHADCARVAERHGVPFVCVPVEPGAKAEAEARLLDLVAEHRIDVVVLARYMQILSPELCQALDGRIINIHHSFLPGFKGAKPYHQAWERGVKLIGATAHYATADLDDGPIIDQDVVRVTHASRPEDMVSLGRDIERTVLARALRLHVEDRVVVVGKRTVVFAP